ncbi:alpha/beta-hydrolase [Astrocystis sublimbata]|nr:alpha/beta-hydrolase [Astrocystis sublimbata]
MYKLALLGLLVGTACQASMIPAAHPRDDHFNTKRNCRNLTVDIDISAVNQVWTFKPPHGNIEVTEFILNYTEPDGNFTEKNSNGNTTKSGSYQIAATYCEPPDGPGKALQILTHGISFSRSYWDHPVHNYNYSYVNAALSRNYSTFFYDRLGVGESSKGDPLNEIQPALEISALQALTTMLRNTSVPGIKTKYETIVHVGHSFGSLLTYAFTNSFPALSDAIALTGFGLDADFATQSLLGDSLIAANSFKKWKSFHDGYLIHNALNSLQVGFFSPENFDVEVLKAAYRSIAPRTIGEVLSQDTVPLQSQFGGPVLVVTGERDAVVCGGNCLATTPSIPKMSKSAFVKKPPFKAFIVPATGHALNFHYTFPTTYGVISDFFDKMV